MGGRLPGVPGRFVASLCGLALMAVLASCGDSGGKSDGGSDAGAEDAGSASPVEQVLIDGNSDGLRLALDSAGVDARIVGSREHAIVVELEGEDAREALEAEIAAGPTMEFRPLLPEDAGRECELLATDCHVTGEPLVEATGGLTWILTDDDEGYYGYWVAPEEVDDVRAALQPCVEELAACPTGEVVQVVDGREFAVFDLAGADLATVSFDLRDQHDEEVVLGGVQVPCADADVIDELFDIWHRLAVTRISVDDVPEEVEVPPREDGVVVEAYVARGLIPAFDGEPTMEASMVERVEMDPGAVPVDAVTTTSRIEEWWPVLDITEGTLLTSDMFFGPVTFGAC